ncbi:peptide-N4-(N-acetyl-beta-glucosaminyl)asparagine amidase A, partial [Hysterangium stoloniferum]
PPNDCGTPGSRATTTLNWTATSADRQFDRLSTISFHNVEILRTSTPKPTQTGIIYTYINDVTRYIPLFATPGTLILDLNNIIGVQNLTGEY